MPKLPARTAPAPRPVILALGLLAAFALLLGPATTVEASQAGKAKAGAQERKAAKKGKRQRAHQKRTLRHRRAHQRRLRENRNAKLSGAVAVARRRAKAPVATNGNGVIDAGFENGLFNWNTAGIGDVIPAVTSDVVRSGSSAGRFLLTGDQGRSELILGGNGGGSANDTIELGEGAEGYYAFSFFIGTMVYGEPGAHNLIMQFKGDDDGSPNFALQLWDYEGDDGESGGRGLWSHSEAMDGDRFLAPVNEHQWHDVLIHYKVSGVDAGFYEVYLDGRLVDSRSGVSIIPPDADYVYIKNGIYRDGDSSPGTSELRIDAAKLGPTASSVVPG
jgi:Polysaccharide lyase